MEDFTRFILENNLINLNSLRKNGNKTGKKTKFYKEHNEVFDKLLEKHNTDSILESILIELDKIEKKICTECNNTTKFCERKKRYLEQCSKSCTSKAVNNKRVNTCQERFGVSHPMQLKSFQEKQKNTNNKRYGVNNVFKLDSVKEKSKRTMLQKYGVEYSSQRPEFSEKTKQTCLKKYGVEHHNQNQEVLKKRKQTLIQKYGDNTYQPISNKNDINVEFLLKKFVKNNKINIDEVCDYFQCCRNYWVTNIRPLLPDTVKTFSNKSKTQEEVSDYIKELGFETITDSRTLLKSGKEIDIVVKNKNLSIEFDGLIWHSYGKSKHSMLNNYKNEDKNYHLSKTLECEEQGINLLHIFENEWNSPTKHDIWKSIIHTKLGLNERIYARKCTVKEVSSKESKLFTTENHLQSHVNSSVRLGLYYDNNLVMILTFGKSRYSKKADWELLRACTKKYVTVVGGFKRLLKHFRKHNKGSIISYADRRHSVGNVYTKLGFVEHKPSPPNYQYFKVNMNGHELLSRTQCQKHKLHTFLEVFDDSLTESENMFNNDYRRIWDCGNRVFILE